ncbi:tyrosine--tRNA ligase [Candidatus Uhrbacteria bacterium]|jgi:tyrosyl-tRNA synthetase|nr:tyrosine--tRNA ligase [Candidatus Uhrbacteria bacterium]
MATDINPEKIEHLLTRGVDTVYPKREMLEARLKKGERLRIYVGFDPTAPFLHIGHALQLKKLKEFQDMGHEVIWLIGSFTGMIGDPTDKSATRSQLTKKQVLENAATYKKQASKILKFTGRNAVKIKFNDKWLSKMSFADVVELASHFTVQQMSERDMFANRLKDGKPIYMHEFMYPLMQGYDSVAMDVDVEIGGSDQTFNMLAGRTLMKSMAGKEKIVLTLKLLTNDEGKKMSKSEGGFIALSDVPEDMYGKLMAMNDSMILPYFELVTDMSMEEIDGKRIAMEQGVNPRDVKAELAHMVVAQLYDASAADAAAAHFANIFQKGKMPDEMEEFVLSSEKNIVDVLVESGLTKSKSEARRMIEQKAVKIDGVVVTGIDMNIVGAKDGVVLQRGKRHFVRLVNKR